MQAAEIESFLTSIQQKIVAKQFDSALSELSEFRARESFNPEAVYMAAVCHRYLGNHGKALEELQELKVRVPEHGRAHQEEGHTYRKMGDHHKALAAFSRACRHNPALTASWKAQIELAQALGRNTQASAAQQQLQYLQSLPQALVAVTDLIAQGKLLKAEEICREFLKQVPHHVEAMRLLAKIGTKLGIYDDAEFLLFGATELQPDNDQLRIDYIQALRKRQKFELATEQAKILLEKEPDNLQFQSIYAVDCMQIGKFDEALKHFNKILTKIPSDPITLTSKGHAHKTQGDLDQAIKSYRNAVTHTATYGEAYFSLANLKTYKFRDEELSAMLTQDSNSNLDHMERVYLYFALGKAFEDKKDYEQSFHFYSQGNALKKAQSQYKAERMTEDLAAQRQACTEKLFETQQGVGCKAPDPIFILGLPRAGSTLLEQILSSHSQVDGTLELPNILSLSQRLRRRSRTSKASPYPEILADLTPEELNTFGEEFIRETKIHRQQAPFFIDKMPNNFRHIGLIKLILPNAKIIDARRNALDCCWSGFKQLFAEGQEFTYDLSDIGQYYRDYVDLMSHWDNVIPEFVLRVNNEDVIEDLEGQVQRILEFCELPFEESCLNFHQTQRNVRTPSADQVRKPVSRAGVAQWKPFEAHLAPLQKALGEELTQLSYEHTETSY